MRPFPLQEDIALVRELLGQDDRTLSLDMGLSRMTLNRWFKNPEQASPGKLEAFYGYAFKKGIRLNEIHAQLFIEEARSRGLVPLFHGSKSGIVGGLSLDSSREDNDFGKGLYCGESYAQAAAFVARYPNSQCYFVLFDKEGLTRIEFSVDERWMLAVARFRGKLYGFEQHSRVLDITREVASADYVVAPIADNRMFDIIDSFVAGEITDAQCRHCLSATSLGSQYVLRTEPALSGAVWLQPHFMCANEKQSLLAIQRERIRIGSDKVKAARRKYRSVGNYIEELLT